MLPVEIDSVRSMLGDYLHVCAFFHTADERNRVLLPYIRNGIDNGRKVFNIVDPNRRAEHLKTLKHAGVDVDAALECGQLEVKGWDEAYLQDGHFDMNAMLHLIEEALVSSSVGGYPITQFMAEMEWSLTDRPGINDLVEYESRLNYVLAKHKHLVVCAYDCQRFGPGIIMDMLRTHPLIIVGGVLQHNPFFVPPDEFLVELRERQVDQGGSGDLVTERRRLSGIARDLLALAAVPAAWVVPEPERMAQGMADMLMSAFRPAAVFVRLNRPAEPPAEATRAEIWPLFEEWLRTSKLKGAGSAVQQFAEVPMAGGSSLRIAIVPIGIDAEGGVIAVGCTRPRFPEEMESPMLSVVANQAFILFKEARILHERYRTERVIQVLEEELDRKSMFEEIVGTSPALQDVLSRVAKVAPTDSTVLITGESGTGKELVARAIHKNSHRKGRPLVSVNCAALAPTLIGSELFGHEKGSFTGAQERRLGRFELADGGTIFLDEVGDMPADAQTVLLRVLQERQFERVGGNRAISVDVRVIAATNRNLQADAAAGKFRMDLLYRLNVFPIVMPPLRERKADIEPLTKYFIQHFAQKMGKRIRNIEQQTLDRFSAYSWPGNVRELQNVIERSVILCESDTFVVDQGWLPASSPQLPPGPYAQDLLDREKELIESALIASKGKVGGGSGAATKLGIPSSTLESRIKALKVNKHRFKPV